MGVFVHVADPIRDGHDALFPASEYPRSAGLDMWISQQGSVSIVGAVPRIFLIDYGADFNRSIGYAVGGNRRDRPTCGALYGIVTSEKRGISSVQV